MPKTTTKTTKVKKHESQHATQPKNAKTDIAEPKELNDILIAEVGHPRTLNSAKTKFLETGIIAERRYPVGRKKREVTDYLVEGLPVWRRHGDGEGVDESHLEAWDSLNGDQTNVVQAHVKRYNVTMHRTHPFFERWTGAKDFFENGLKETSPVPQIRRAGDVDERDRTEALEMLGRMIDKCLDETVEGVNVLNDLTVDVYNKAERNHTREAVIQAKEYITHGRRYLAKNSLGQRQDLAERLLANEQASDFHSWTIALCIATIPLEEFLEQWQANSATISRAYALNNRRKACRQAISTFLDDYHHETRPKKNFIYTLRTYSTLSEMLRTEPPEMFEGEEALHDEQGQGGDNENDDERVEPKVAHHDMGEGVVTEEPMVPNDEGEEDEDVEELDTQENRIQAIEAAAAREAAKAVPGKRNMRPRKRKNEDVDALGAVAERGEKRRKSGGLTVRPH